MIEQDNPFITPTETPALDQPSPWREILFVFGWVVLAGIFGSMNGSFVRYFEEFGLQLPLLTLVVVSPIAPLLINTLAIVIVYAFMAVRHTKQRRTMRNSLVIFSVAFAVILIAAFFLPLFSLIKGLS